jgi:hypothetical protein
MWQKCPLCTTKIQVEHSIQICTVCNGAKIISQLTGLPPNRSSILDSAVSTKQSNFDNRDLSGTLDSNPKAFT